MQLVKVTSIGQYPRGIMGVGRKGESEPGFFKGWKTAETRGPVLASIKGKGKQNTVTSLQLICCCLAMYYYYYYFINMNMLYSLGWLSVPLLKRGRSLGLQSYKIQGLQPCSVLRLVNECHKYMAKMAFVGYGFFQTAGLPKYVSQCYTGLLEHW